LNERGIIMKLSPEAKQWIIRQGLDPAYGARPLRRIIQRHIEDPLAEEVLKRNFDESNLILVTVDNDTLTFVEMPSEQSSVTAQLEAMKQ
jgi:ATP-dependent Clp protease ATP-binding subunit ClpA